MARVNQEAVQRFAEALRQMPDIEPPDFYSVNDGKEHDTDRYPPLDHPQAVNFFFLACLHQYGFWHGNCRGYRAPMFATFGGKKVKGSDAVWFALKRALDRDHRLIHPGYLVANLDEHVMWEQLFVDDDGPIRFPDPARRLESTRQYAAFVSGPAGAFPSILRMPQAILKMANGRIREFLDMVMEIPGFGDPLEKKARLLALTLVNRPERFLYCVYGETLPPIVDYHLMRVSLRLGLVEIDATEDRANVLRLWVDGRTERGIRQATHEALVEVQRLSGVSSDKLDYAMWSARSYCPEVEKPDCAKCRFAGVCAQRVFLFQPVYRTTAY